MLALPHALWNPLSLHGLRSLLVSMIGALPWRSIEHGLERLGHRDRHVLSGLTLAHFDAVAVIGGPRKAQEIALALSSIDREQHRQPTIMTVWLNELEH